MDEGSTGLRPAARPGLPVAAAHSLKLAGQLRAAFYLTTGWIGKTITDDEAVFAFEGHGGIWAADVLIHDGQGHVSWAYEGVSAAVRPDCADRGPLLAAVGSGIDFVSVSAGEDHALVLKVDKSRAIEWELSVVQQAIASKVAADTSRVLVSFVGSWKHSLELEIRLVAKDAEVVKVRCLGASSAKYDARGTGRQCGQAQAAHGRQARPKTTYPRLRLSPPSVNSGFPVPTAKSQPDADRALWERYTLGPANSEAPAIGHSGWVHVIARAVVG